MWSELCFVFVTLIWLAQYRTESIDNKRSAGAGMGKVKIERQLFQIFVGCTLAVLLTGCAS